MPVPARGEMWLTDFDPVVGHEQGGRRPCLIVSMDIFNRSPADLVVGIPLTTRARGVPLHVPISPPEGGLHSQSYAMGDAVRSISKLRLIQRWGMVTPVTLARVEDALRILMGL